MFRHSNPTPCSEKFVTKQAFVEKLMGEKINTRTLEMTTVTITHDHLKDAKLAAVKVDAGKVAAANAAAGSVLYAADGTPNTTCLSSLDAATILLVADATGIDAKAFKAVFKAENQQFTGAAVQHTLLSTPQKCGAGSLLHVARVRDCVERILRPQ